jgi:hypothetical protein
VSDLPAGWATVSLGTLGTWVGGGTPSKNVPSFWHGDIPWVSPKDMKASRIGDTQDHITHDSRTPRICLGGHAQRNPPPLVAGRRH